MTNITKNIVRGEDGVYRWVYELNLYTNPIILFLIWKIFGYICLGMWIIMFLLNMGDNGFWWDGFFDMMQGCLLFTLGFFTLCLIGYLVYAFMVGGKYCVLFEMDEKGVNHIQMEPQVKKADMIGTLTMLAGMVAGKPGVIGTGLLAKSRTSMHSSFDSVKSVEAFPSRNLIKVNEFLNKNQVYAEKEDFDFVLGFIREHTNCA
jgi:hypothetical protein